MPWSKHPFSPIWDFRSVQEVSLDASKNGNLSHSHADLDVRTDRKAGNGARSALATTETRSDDPLDDGLPPDLDGRKGNGPHTWRAVPEDRRPALGPEGDSLDDLK